MLFIVRSEFSNSNNCIPVGPFNSSYLAIVHKSACNKFLKSCKSTLDTCGGKFAKSGEV